MPMRPVTVRKSAAGFTSWIPLNRYSDNFGVALGVSLSSGAVLTYTVQHTFDDLFQIYKDLTIARVTTTATVTRTNHGLSVGDWVKITNSGSSNLDGEYSVASVVDANNFTYTVVDTGAASAGGNVGLQWGRVFAHETLAALTVSADGNYEFPPRASRLNISAYTSGFVDFTVISGGK